MSSRLGVIMRSDVAPTVERVCAAQLPTRFGPFNVSGYRSLISSEEFVAVWVGELSPMVSTLVRVHSQCLTGEVFGSVRCDCASQLETSMQLMQAEGLGAIVYQFQEGRGIGILNKIKAYALQDTGADTVEANERLGFPPDLRNFRQCAEILLDLNVRRVRVISNNPAKLETLERAGLKVISRVQVPFDTSGPAWRYLQAKRDKLGHLLDAPAPPNGEVSALAAFMCRTRTSCCSFSSRDVAPESLRLILEAASFAPSSFNEQPWSFVVAQRSQAPEAFEEMLSCLAPHNRQWASTAPVLVLSAAKRTFTSNGMPNRHALHDVGLAMANLTLQATALGLGIHQMGGFDQSRARAGFAVPHDYEPVTITAVGHSCRQPEDDLLRDRHPIDRYVHWARWGTPFS